MPRFMLIEAVPDEKVGAVLDTEVLDRDRLIAVLEKRHGRRMGAGGGAGTLFPEFVRELKARFRREHRRLLAWIGKAAPGARTKVPWQYAERTLVWILLVALPDNHSAEEEDPCSR
jgi:hypothetical protein